MKLWRLHQVGLHCCGMLFLSVLACIVAVTADDLHVIYTKSFYGTPLGNMLAEGDFAATKFIIEKINNDTSILPNHRLVLQQTTFSVEEASLHNLMAPIINAAFDDDLNPILSISAIPTSVEKTVSLAELSSTVQIPYCETIRSSPRMNDHTDYPALYRAIPPSTATEDLSILFETYGWKRALLLAGESNGMPANVRHVGFFDNKDILSVSLSTNYVETEVTNALRVMDRDHYKIVIMALTNPLTAIVLRRMEELGLRSSRTIILSQENILPGTEPVYIHTLGLDPSILDGTLGFRYRFQSSGAQLMADIQPWSEANGITVPGPPPYLAVTTDCVASMAHALHQALEVDGKSIGNLSMPEQMSYLRNVSYDGYSGPFTFNENLDRVGAADYLVRFHASTSLFEAVGSVVGETLTLTAPLFPNTVAPPDAFPPDAVTSGAIIISNVTTTSFECSWYASNTYNAGSERFTLHTRVVGAATTSFQVIANLTGSDTLSANVVGLKPGSTVELFIRVTTHAGTADSALRTVQVDREVSIEGLSTSVFAVVMALSCLGLVVSLVMHACFAVYVSSPIIKSSSPAMMHVFLFGGLLAHGGNIASLYKDTMCTVTPALYAFGFTFMFGSLFAKTYRIFFIFLSKSLHAKTIFDKHLFGALGVLVVIEAIILSTWFIQDKPEPVLRREEDDPFVQHWACRVENDQLWWIVELAPKFLMLSLGAILAFRVRHIHNVFNESRVIAFSLWNTVVMGTIALGLRSIVEDHETRTLVSSVAVWVITASTVCILAVPKVLAVGLSNDDLFAPSSVNNGGGTNGGLVGTFVTGATRKHSFSSSSFQVVPISGRAPIKLTSMSRNKQRRPSAPVALTPPKNSRKLQPLPILKMSPPSPRVNSTRRSGTLPLKTHALVDLGF